ncbi:MAG: Hsp20/alpha crystallin family protein [Candidatus Pacebacteria bacterium]|nr:Hsp20/alpha crystallin family protein [Candidatus Paceibacterota bacterium]
MTKQKQSFLDKIGSSDDNDEIQEKDIEIKNSVDENLSSDLEERLKEEEIAENEKDDMALDETERKDENDKEWFDKESGSSDEEGQLTVDVYKTEEDIVIKSIIGGVRSEDLDISVTNDMVTIKGKRNNIDEVVEDDYYYQECFWGNFSRSIILPCDIKADGVEATIKNGILTIKLPKIEKNTSMKIEIKEE